MTLGGNVEQVRPMVSQHVPAVDTLDSNHPTDPQLGVCQSTGQPAHGCTPGRFESNMTDPTDDSEGPTVDDRLSGMVFGVSRGTTARVVT
jgi:hypothetical protein